MTQRDEIVAYADELLAIDQYDDYCPNGLQVEGVDEITSLASGVTACMRLLDAAVDAGAQALLVHHGYFWKNEDPRVTGMKRRRLARLLDAGINLIAYHLPLDGHPVYGNNAQLAALLDIEPERDLPGSPGPGIAVSGSLREPLGGEQFAERVAQKLGRQPLHIPGTAEKISRIGWCTGGGQSFIEAAAKAGMDAFLTGEVSESTVHVARENGLHFFAAGHHATERYGAEALGRHLAEKFGLSYRHIDIDNPA